MKGEVGKEQEMDNRLIFMTSQMTFSAVPHNIKVVINDIISSNYV